MNETLDAIATTLRGTLERHCTDAELRKAEAGAWSEALWASLVDAGVPLSTVPESADGLGLGLAEAAFIARIAAAHAAPVPIAETLLANALWGKARGEAFARIASVLISGNELQRTSRPDGTQVLSGRLASVPWARHASALLLVIADGDSSLLARIQLAGAALQQRANLADEPRDTLTLEAAEIAPRDLARLPAMADQIAALMALMRAAQLVGAMEKAVEITVRYANERVQFGKPIARFQAVQHQIAYMAELVAASAVTLEQAAASAGDPDKAPLIWAAKGLASESAGQIAAISHQVHGAIGFTREYRLQLLTRRLWSWREECGNENEWYARLGALAASQGADGLWPWIVDVSPSG